jgi:phenylpyruvate tautomerase PptA (4-oxalocrotonate tautomerase family)/ketosteroid isomerase-like protein
MPMIRITLIEGYDEETRGRLLAGLSAVARTVLDAPPDGIVAAIEEVKPGSYRRGNLPRQPKPVPPTPEQVARDYLAAMERRDLAAAKAYLADGFVMTFPGGKQMRTPEELVEFSRPRYRRVAKAYERFDTVPGMEAATVYCFGTLHGEWPDGRPFDGIRFIDRFTVSGGKLVDQMVWNDLAEIKARQPA